MRRDLEKPVGFFKKIYKCDLELDVFGAHSNYRALDPRSGEGANQMITGSHNSILAVNSKTIRIANAVKLKPQRVNPLPI